LLIAVIYRTPSAKVFATCAKALELIVIEAPTAKFQRRRSDSKRRYLCCAIPAITQANIASSQNLL
jgi:hypothetical protein